MVLLKTLLWTQPGGTGVQGVPGVRAFDGALTNGASSPTPMYE